MNLNPTLPSLVQGAALALCLMASPIQAKNFGVHGTTFPIGEVDMLKWIDARLKGFEQSGKLADMQEEFQSRVKHKVSNPTPLNIGTTTSPKTFFVNPSVTFPTDIRDPNTGRLFAAKGQTINPFDTATWPEEIRDLFPKVELSKVLLFLDARDPKQRAFAQSFTHEKPVKVILTGGNLDTMAKALETRIYFDQQGHLIDKLHIQHVPSLAYQEGIRWRIDEYDVSQYPTE